MRIDPVTLRTIDGGLLLRPWRDGDAVPLLAAYDDPVLRRWTRLPVRDRADALRWLDVQAAGWRDGTRYSFAVLTDGADGAARLAGNVALKTWDLPAGRAEVGYWTAGSSRGRGVAPRAVEAVTRWAFAAFARAGLGRIELRHQVDNPASCRVAAKTGYRLEAILPAAPPTFPRDGHLHVRDSPVPGPDGGKVDGGRRAGR